MRATALRPQAPCATGVLRLGLSQQGSSSSPVPMAMSHTSYTIAPVLCAAERIRAGVDGVRAAGKPEKAESAWEKRA